tara:strand:+ start:87 stop:320 length:234 start_codon:yes stop_codon:yes gene_type:complete
LACYKKEKQKANKRETKSKQKRNKKQTKKEQKANKKGTKSKKGSETFKNNSFDKARCYLVYKNCIKVCANNLTIRKI